MLYKNEKITFDGSYKRSAPVCSLSLCRAEESPELMDFLTEHEKEAYLSLGCRRRKQEWFSARIGLKKILLEEGLIKLPTHCSIDKDTYGRPYITSQGTESESRIIHHDCSISHKDGYSIVAVAMRPGIKIGVDIEVISERLYRLRGAFVNEADSIMSLAVDNAELHTILWTCKEAASKVIGLGIFADFKSLIVEEHGNKKISISWKEGQYIKYITGSFSFWKDFIIAVCYAFPSL